MRERWRSLPFRSDIEGLRRKVLKENCTPDVGSQMHTPRGFRVRMNDKADYPQVLEVIEEVPLPKAQKRKSSSLPAPGIT